MNYNVAFSKTVINRLLAIFYDVNVMNLVNKRFITRFLNVHVDKFGAIMNYCNNLSNILLIDSVLNRFMNRYNNVSINILALKIWYNDL